MHPVNVEYSHFRCTTTQLRVTNGKNGIPKTTNMHFTIIIGSNLHKKAIEKE